MHAKIETSGFANQLAKERVGTGKERVGTGNDDSANNDSIKETVTKETSETEALALAKEAPVKEATLNEAQIKDVMKPEESLEKSEDPKKWTVLLYLNGNNNMQSQILSTLRLSEFTGSSNDVNVVAQVSRNHKWYDFFTKDWSGARRYYVTKRPDPPSIIPMLKELFRMYVPPFTAGITSQMLEDLGKVNMGDPETLKKSILDTMKQFPAQHYMVWMKGPSLGTQGISHDSNTKDNITPSELEKVLKEVKEETGKEVDILTLEGSGTASLEMAYQLKDGAKYLIGSQEALNGAGFATPALLNEIVRLNEDPENPQAAHPLQIAQLLGQIESIASTINPLFSPAMSVIDLSKAGEVVKEVEKLGKGLEEAKVPREHILKLIHNTQSFGAGSDREIHKIFGDLYHFAELISKDPEITSIPVKDAAKDIMKKVLDCVASDGQIPKDNPNTPPLPIQLPEDPDKPDYSNVNGLSINLDLNYGFAAPEKLTEFSLNFDRTRGYQDLAFTKDTGWDKFLNSISKEPKGRKILRNLTGSYGADLAKGLYGSTIGPALWGIWSSEVMGDWEAYNGWSAGKAVNLKLAPDFLANALGLPFIGIPAAVATKTGIIGGLSTAVKGGATVLDGLMLGKKEKKAEVMFPLDEPKYIVDKQKIRDGLFEIGRGSATAGANAALAYSKYALLLNPCGYLVWGIPLAQTALGFYDQWQANKPKAAIKNTPVLDPMFSKSPLANTVVQYFGNRKVRD